MVLIRDSNVRCCSYGTPRLIDKAPLLFESHHHHTEGVIVTVTTPTSNTSFVNSLYIYEQLALCTQQQLAFFLSLAILQ